MDTSDAAVLREALAGAPWEWDLTSNTVEASLAYRRLVGLPDRAALRPFHLLPLMTDAERERVLDTLFRTISGEETDAISFRILLDEGTERLVRATAKVIRDDDGAPRVVRGRLRHLVSGLPEARNRETDPDNERPITVAIVGSDRVARLGLRSLLAPFPGLRVGPDFAPNDEAIASLDARPDHWGRIGTVIVDVGADDEALRNFIQHLRARHPGTRIIARIQPQAFHCVAWLVRVGVDRLVTSNISDTALAQAIADAATPAVTVAAPADDRRSLLSGEASAFELSSTLTDAELQVLRMLARGFRNREIATRLFVSEPTVKRYTQRIYRKLGARHRAHATALANRFHLV